MFARCDGIYHKPKKSKPCDDERDAGKETGERRRHSLISHRAFTSHRDVARLG